VVRTCWQAAVNSATGKVLAEGRPPAKLMMPGFSVTLRISRITDGFMRAARRAMVQWVAVGRSLGFMVLGPLGW
jgi:hypothetical protein